MALADFQVRVNAAANKLLSTEVFSSLKKVPVPNVFVDAYPQENEERKKQIEGADPIRDCPVFLANIRKIDGELLNAGLAHVLSGMQTVVAARKNGMLPGAPPNKSLERTRDR